MTNPDFSQVFESLVHISNDLSKLLAAQSILLFDSTFKIAFFAQLGDNVASAIDDDSLIKFDDVGMLYFFEDFDLFKNKGLEMFELKFVELHYFYGNLLFFISKGLLV